MRSKEEVYREYCEYEPKTDSDLVKHHKEKIMLEVFLDVRELLSKIANKKS